MTKKTIIIRTSVTQVDGEIAFKKTMGKRIKNLREQVNISQDTLAEILSVGRSSISQYESGDKTPELSRIIMLALYFNVSIDFLAGLTDCPTPINRGNKRYININTGIWIQKNSKEEIEDWNKTWGDNISTTDSEEFFAEKQGKPVEITKEMKRTFKSNLKDNPPKEKADKK